jgi:acetyl-CoA acetyltransferase family protein
MALLLAGLPVEVPGQTVNRLCGSGLQAVVSATHAIRANEGHLFIAGGVESMTRAPQVMLKSSRAWDRSTPGIADSTVGWRFVNPRMPEEWTISLGETAERVAQMYGISRQEQDEFALASQQRAEAAMSAGAFADELVPVEVNGPAGARTVNRDEPPRSGLTIEALAKLEPAFVASGTVTAGTSSGINDGAAALSVASAQAMSVSRLEPMARVVATAVAGVDPSCMGLGPIPATRKALDRAGLTVADLDLVELNEAFAAQAIACIRELGLGSEKVNIYGGAIAIGHPLGASGARILTTLVHALRRTGGRYGLATMCIGVGQGIAVIVEATG